jgi:hypothetical protein
MKTRNGTPCSTVPGPRGTRITKVERGQTFVYVQLLPTEPQRFAWVNERNLYGNDARPPTSPRFADAVPVMTQIALYV